MKNAHIIGGAIAILLLIIIVIWLFFSGGKKSRRGGKITGYASRRLYDVYLVKKDGVEMGLAIKSKNGDWEYAPFKIGGQNIMIYDNLAQCVMDGKHLQKNMFVYGSGEPGNPKKCYMPKVTMKTYRSSLIDSGFTLVGPIKTLNVFMARYSS